jgi:hypothetical protein
MSFVLKSNDMNPSLWDSRHSADSSGSVPARDTVHHLQNYNSVDGSIRIHHNSVSLICQFLFLLIAEWKEHFHCQYWPIGWFLHPSRRFLDYSTILCLVPRSRSASTLEYWWFRLYRSYLGHWICFCLQVEVSGGTCSVGSIRRGKSNSTGHVFERSDSWWVMSKTTVMFLVTHHCRNCRDLLHYTVPLKSWKN